MHPESKLTGKIAAALHARGAWVLKYHVSPYSRAGVPDLLVCYRGRFLALEVKVPGGHATALQLRELARIRAAGGTAEVVTTVGEVLKLCDAIDDGSRDDGSRSGRGL